jgi:hypothetical protein
MNKERIEIIDSIICHYRSLKTFLEYNELHHTCDYVLSCYLNNSLKEVGERIEEFKNWNKEVKK